MTIRNQSQFLLHSVSLVNKKYQEISKITGENFNIFNVLNLQNEETKHSKIIAELLNPKGSHDCNDIFLNAFLDCLSNQIFNCKVNLNTQKVRVNIEEYIGKVNEKGDEGGRVDIVINDGSSAIVIENKIFASDQDKQLLRYKNQFKNGIILYLTLNGRVASEESSVSLKPNEDYYSVSYDNFIVTWITKCRELAITKPYIREILSQYIDTINLLNNQSKNKQMTEEILDLMFKDESSFESAKKIADEFEKAKALILDKFWSEVSNELGLQYKMDTFFHTPNNQKSALFIKTTNPNIAVIFEPLNDKYLATKFSKSVVGEFMFSPLKYLKKTTTNFSFLDPKFLGQVLANPTRREEIKKEIIKCLVDYIKEKNIEILEK